MNRATFFKHFELLADQPDAVDRMRELVLHLAVRGKLVSQNPKDEPAQAMLQRISSSAKARFRGPIESENFDFPFNVPSNWVWVRLPQVLNKLTDGTHHSPTNVPSGDFKYVTAKNIKNDGVLLDNISYVTKKVHDEIYSRCDPGFGDVLYIKDGATTGIATINQLKEPFSMLSSVALLKPSEAIFNRFLLWVMRSPFFYQETRGAMKGAAITRVTLSVMAKSLLPIPPLAEQRRIVAKVDELMALCDELEQRQQARQHASGILQQSALHHLLAAREPQTFATAWQRVRDHFHILHDTPDAIPQLRQAILQLAVQGRLVPHEKVRDQNVECAEATEVFPIPTAWQWVTFQDLTDSAFTGLERSRAEQSPDREFAYLKMNNITNEGGCDLTAVIRVDASSDEAAKYCLQPGDFLFNTRNSFELVGKTCVFQPNRKDVFLFNNNMLKVSFIGGVELRFINLWCCSPIGRSELSKLKSATTNVAAIYQGKLATLPVPLPPLAEQKRIVARVEELLRWCDTLEAQLHQTRTLGAHLLDSTLHHLLAA